jgi:hypothetical protein
MGPAMTVQERHDAILRYYRANKTLTWSEIGDHFNAQPTVVRRIITKAEKARDPNWKKPRKGSVYVCQEPGCRNRFRGVRGYNGARDALYCESHRRAK